MLTIVLIRCDLLLGLWDLVASVEVCAILLQQKVVDKQGVWILCFPQLSNLGICLKPHSLMGIIIYASQTALLLGSAKREFNHGNTQGHQ